MALLFAPGFRALGTRGAHRIVEGFRPGRWDARFIVARGPSAVELTEPAGLTLVLSGPARLLIRTEEEDRRVSLDLTPSPIALSLPHGGRAMLEADGTIRLHEVDVRRIGPPPWRRGGLVVLVSMLAALLAWVRRGGWALAVSILLTAFASALALRGDLGALALRVWMDRLAPAFGLLLVAASFPGALLVATRRVAAVTGEAGLARKADGDNGLNLPILCGSLALVSCLAQVLFLPQPLLIGDPAAYHDIGGRFLSALKGVRTPDDLANALQTLRPYGGLAATGLLYAGLRGLHDDLPTIYVVQALAVAGAVGLLVRCAIRVGGRRLGLLTGALALLYPTFPVICGIVQPEPVILLLWTWALDLLLASREDRDPRRIALSGLAFALGLALHPQGMWFLLVALVLLLLPWARRLIRGRWRPQAVAFALGILPVAVATAAGEAYARRAAYVLDERHGFWAFTAPVPLGFWLFVDTDGWQGPLRIVDTRYARGLLEAQEAGKVSGTLGRLTYTARFVASNLTASLRTVLRNLQRLFHVPDNPFRRDWVLPYAWQVPWHRALVVLFLLAAPLALARGAQAILVPFLILSATYPLYHIFNKYAVPATPCLLLGAALALERLLVGRDLAMGVALSTAAIGALVRPADLAWRGLDPGVAHVVLSALHLGGLAVAFFLVGKRWTRGKAGRWSAAGAGAILIVPMLTASWGNPSRRAYSVALEHEVRYEVSPGPAGLEALDTAREAYVLLDLRIPDGEARDLRLEFGSGLTVPGTELVPGMPTFGLATLRGGLDPRAFRQWWRTPWRKEMASGGRVTVAVRGLARHRLFGDLAAPDRNGIHQGLSLGQWPYLSVYRLMHDGEYRLSASQPMAGGARMGQWEGRRLPGIPGIRLITVAEDGGGASWETAIAPAREVVTAIWAHAPQDLRAELQLPARRVRLDLASPEGAATDVRFISTGDREGWLVMKAAAEAGRPLKLAVRPLQELSPNPRSFLPELRADAPPIPLDWSALPYVPPARILESRENPPWRPGLVF